MYTHTHTHVYVRGKTEKTQLHMQTRTHAVHARILDKEGEEEESFSLLILTAQGDSSHWARNICVFYAAKICGTPLVLLKLIYCGPVRDRTHYVYGSTSISVHTQHIDFPPNQGQVPLQVETRTSPGVWSPT